MHFDRRSTAGQEFELAFTYGGGVARSLQLLLCLTLRLLFSRSSPCSSWPKDVVVARCSESSPLIQGTSTRAFHTPGHSPPDSTRKLLNLTCF
eukprot:6200480-Pleurochrysis_carterae.AAC.3